jgi:hypothetical protein
VGKADYIYLLLFGQIDLLIKTMQAWGLWGPRHIRKKVLELPIPQFDPTREERRELVEPGRACIPKSG